VNRQGEYIRRKCERMKVGQCLVFERNFFNDAFPCGWPSIYETPDQVFLSSMVGSAFGGWKVDRNYRTGDVRVSRHKESDRRYYVDPDRQHLFTKMPDGTLELKEGLEWRP
jgi:hypothetical protein